MGASFKISQVYTGLQSLTDGESRFHAERCWWWALLWFSCLNRCWLQRIKEKFTLLLCNLWRNIQTSTDHCSSTIGSMVSSLLSTCSPETLTYMYVCGTARKNRIPPMAAAGVPHSTWSSFVDFEEKLLVTLAWQVRCLHDFNMLQRIWQRDHCILKSKSGCDPKTSLCCLVQQVHGW